MNDFRALVIEEEGGETIAVLLVPEDKITESGMDAVHELAAFFCQRVRNIVPDVCADLDEVQAWLREMNRTEPCECELPGMFNSGVPGILAQVQDEKSSTSLSGVISANAIRQTRLPRRLFGRF